MTPTHQQPPKEQIVDMAQLEEYMLTRASEFQKRGFWDSSFECLYLITVLNRGYYWDTEGRKQIIRSRPHQAPATAEFSIGYAEGYKEGTRKAREDVLKDKMLIVEEFHKIFVTAHIDTATFLCGESVINEIRELTKQSLRSTQQQAGRK